MPEISVIVPVYKVEKYLCRCVDSILKQSFRDFELILVDDGSPDNCGRICGEYAAKDRRVRVIHKENGGVSSARNAGLEAAGGKYILFCDGDDYVHPDWCRVLHETACRFPNGLVVHNGWQEQPTGEDRRMIDPSVQDVAAVEEITYYQCFVKNLSGAVWNKVFLKEIIDQKKLRFDETRALGEDVLFVAAYLTAVSPIIYVARPLYHYTINPEGAVRRYYWDLLEQHLLFFRTRLPYIGRADLPAFCDTYFCCFVTMLHNTMDPRNPMPFRHKLRYNHRMLNTGEFRYCLEHATFKNENPVVVRLLKTRNYYLFWLFMQAVSVKNRIMGKTTEG